MANPLGMGVNAQFIPPINALNLGQQLITALQNDNHQAVENILIHPQVNLISAADLGQAIIICIAESLEYYVEIFDLPNAQQIPANGQWGLGSALVETARIQDPIVCGAFKIIQILIILPQMVCGDLIRL